MIIILNCYDKNSHGSSDSLRFTIYLEAFENSDKDIIVYEVRPIIFCSVVYLSQRKDVS